MVILLACVTPPADVDLHFVRGGVVQAGRFEARAWTPGEAGAPLLPECVPLFSVPLEDMQRLAAMGAPPPAAALAFSPDGAWLAIGSEAGSLRIVDAWTGEVRAERHMAEGAVKQVAWSPDGAVLYAGEQSPDAMLLAFDAATLAPRWSFRLADELETSALPPADDVYGLYSLPGAFAVRVLPDGGVLVSGAHGWPHPDGTRHNRSRIWRLAPDGTRLAAWPPDAPVDAVFLHPDVSGARVLLGVSRSADGPAPADLPVNGVVVLDLATLTPVWEQRFEPLEPYFHGVFLWEAVALDDALVLAGLGDGRAFLFGADGTLAQTLTPGVPVLSQGVPIAAGVGFGDVFDRTAYFLTTETNIPWGSADPMTRPPAAHPAQYTAHAVGIDGEERWSWQADHALAGIRVSPDGRDLVVGAGPRISDARTDLYGALVLDRLTGALRASCATEGPAYFRPEWAPESGRIAVAESPFVVDGDVRGAYRVTVFR